MLVHVVGQHPDVAVAHEHVGQRFQLVTAVGAAGGVRRRVEDQPLGLRRDRRLERCGRHLEAVFEGGVDKHRLTTGQQRDVGIGNPVWCGDDHLVAGVKRRHHRVVDDRLSARRDKSLFGRVVEPVLALELGADSLFQFGDTIDRGVFRLTRVDRLDRRCLDIIGGVEIGFTGAQADDIATGGLEFGGLRRDGYGCGGLNAIERVGNETHGKPLFDRVHRRFYGQNRAGRYACLLRNARSNAEKTYGPLFFSAEPV